MSNPSRFAAAHGLGTPPAAMMGSKASTVSFPVVGSNFPRSQRLTDCKETLSSRAAASWLNPSFSRTVLSRFVMCPILCLDGQLCKYFRFDWSPAQQEAILIQALLLVRSYTVKLGASCRPFTGNTPANGLPATSRRLFLGPLRPEE